MFRCVLLYILHFILYILQCVLLYILHFILYILRYALYVLQCVIQHIIIPSVCYSVCRQPYSSCTVQPVSAVLFIME